MIIYNNGQTIDPYNISFLGMDSSSDGVFFSNGYMIGGFDSSLIEGLVGVESSKDLWLTARKKPVRDDPEADPPEYKPEIISGDELVKELESAGIRGIEGGDQLIHLTQLTDEVGNVLKKDILVNYTNSDIAFWRVRDKRWLMVSSEYLKFINPVTGNNDSGFKDYTYIDVTNKADEDGYVAIGNQFRSSPVNITENMQQAIDEWIETRGDTEDEYEDPRRCMPEKVWVWEKIFVEPLTGIKNKLGSRPCVIVNIKNGIVWTPQDADSEAYPYPFAFQV